MTGETGTQERKRALKAMPPRVDAASPGCAGALLVYSALCGALFWLNRSWWWLALGAPAVIGLAAVVTRWVREQILLAASQRVLESRGVRCLVVYSESPAWAEHIRRRWLSRLGNRAVTLNWSQQASWPASLEVRLFNHFVRPSAQPFNFNPAVLVFRGGRRPHVFRFYFAFQQAKHGRRQYLETLEAEMFNELDR